jgi:N12 class adenine-specific DNA methylase
MAAFNKKAHLRRNIDAIKVAFTLEKENRPPTYHEKTILRSYSGFGAIKEVLDAPGVSLSGVKPAPDSMTALLDELRDVIKENTANEKESKRYFDGIKDSILTAFYTPPEIADTIAKALQFNALTPKRVLDPSAGNGIFSDSIREIAPDADITCFEKDPITGLILKHLRPEDNVRIQGYETIEPKYNGYYDLAVSNIPFGDVSIFDPAFSTDKDPARRQATRTLHNYFFMKSVDSVRDGGIVAFITSQGVMNSERNRPVREWLMDRCDLVSAIRLPNNLFTEHAGTEVGSDLIVLQKRQPPRDQAMTPRQMDFIDSEVRSGVSTSKLFNPDRNERILSTGYKLDTDPYGKPAFVYTHRAGNSGLTDIDGMAKDLYEMLRQDIYRNLDLERYHLNAPQITEQANTQTVAGENRQFPDDLDPFWQAVEDHFENSRPEAVAEELTPEQSQQEPQPEPSIPDDPFWQATPEDWQRFSQWFQEREAQMKAEAEGFNLNTETGELTPIEAAEPSPEITPEPAQDYQPTDEDFADFGAWAAEQDRRRFEENPPQPEDYGIAEPEEIAEGIAAQETQPQPEAVETATTEPQVSAAPGNFAGTLFDMDNPAILKSPQTESVKSEVNVQQEPLITLYDLFGFSQEERSQMNRPRRQKKKPGKSKKDAEQVVLDWREELILERQQREERRQEQAEPASPQSAYPVEDARKAEHEAQLRRIEQEKRREEEQREREEYYKPIPFKAEILPHYREGSLVTDENNRIGYLRNIDALQPMFHPLELSETQGTKASIYVEIRDTYYHLYQNEAERLEANPALREMLNRLYDNFTERFGGLNDKKNLDLIKMDARGTEILSLERYIDGVAQKADIFNHPVAFNPNELTQAADGREALVASLNKYAGVNLDYMAGLTGGTKDSLLEELHGTIYFNPEIEGYEVADKYISGNVIVKAERVERFLKDNPDHTAAEQSLKALHEATPKPIAFDDLDFNFGERWIPKGVYERYASWLFDTHVTVSFAPNIDEYGVKADRMNAKIWDQYAVDSQSRKFNGLHLLKHALHNTTPDITKKVNKLIDGKVQEVKVRDGEKIQLANSKIDEIRDGFSDWLREQSPEFKDRLTDMYNRTFNCFVRPQYDGSHQTFPGLDLKGLGIDDLYKSQKDAIWMDKLQGGGICDHEVGGGKTLIMCVGAMEKKRLGLANKPMITGLKANIHEIARTFCTAYPNARVLYPGKEDFTPKNRERIFREIKNNDWDAVILTHEQFGKIPQSPELQREILQTELDSVEENLEVMKAQGKSVSRAMMKGCVRRKLNLEAKLQTVMHNIENRKDDSVDFKLMGIDHLYVDESHKFKNLTFNTRHDRVAGLGNPEGSARALNMLFALRTIQERTGRDLGATYLSGTTISNSLTELYLLFKYLRPQEMERLNMKTFDAWAAVFAKKTTDYEFSVTNEVVQKERFRYFIKVPELAQLYAEITDFRTAADIGIDRPEKNEILHTIPPTADQRDFIERLVKFAKTGDGELLYRGKLTENEDKAKMLLATNYSRKMSLDMRMIDHDRFGDDVDNKASHAARNIAKYYRDYDQHKGTQFVFSDLGTYKPGEWNIYSEIKRKLVEDLYILLKKYPTFQSKSIPLTNKNG